MKVGEYDSDRYDRMRRIPWLDMDRIQRSRCLVVGAGALGNEVVKCMVLSGFGDITVIDMDGIVISNLSRCLFFRDTDDREVMKSEILAERASELGDSNIHPIVGRIQDHQDWNYDIIFGCLDNISARLHVNSHAMYHKVPFIDGATDGFRGKVQCVIPGGPCLECTMNKSHMAVMDQRFSCTGNGAMFVPKMASEITTTSVIAAMQVREAMKILSGRTDMCVKNVTYYDGEVGTMDTYELSVDPKCPNHDTEELK